MSNLRKGLLLFISALSFILNFCEEACECSGRQVKLNEAERDWLPDNEVGDSLYFAVNEDEDTILYKVDRKSIRKSYGVRHHIFCSPDKKCPEDSVIHGSYREELFYNNSDAMFDYSVSFEKQIDTFIRKIQLPGRHPNLYDFDNQIPNKVVNGKNYKNVYVKTFDSARVNTELDGSFISELSFSKTHGIIRYKTGKGDLYERLPK